VLYSETLNKAGFLYPKNESTVESRLFITQELPRLSLPYRHTLLAFQIQTEQISYNGTESALRTFGNSAGVPTGKYLVTVPNIFGQKQLFL